MNILVRLPSQITHAATAAASTPISQPCAPHLCFLPTDAFAKNESSFGYKILNDLPIPWSGAIGDSVCTSVCVLHVTSSSHGCDLIGWTLSYCVSQSILEIAKFINQ